jgi:hypothetical protein
MAEDQSDELLKLMNAAQSQEYVPPRMVVGRRFISSLECDVAESANHSSLKLNLPNLPMLFTAENEDGAQDFESETERARWKGLGCSTPRDASELRTRIHGLLDARQQERVEIARSLGPNGTRQQYQEACEKRGINPWT